MLYRNITDQILQWVKPLGVINIPDDQEDFWVMIIAGNRIQTFIPIEGEIITSPLDIKLPVNTEKMKDILTWIGVPLESEHPDYLIQQWIEYAVTEPLPYDVDHLPEDAKPSETRDALPDNSN
jgi:hypothetical protein